MPLSELLKDNPDLQSEIDSLVATQATSIAEKTASGLLSKNNELLDELKPLKDLKKRLGEDFDFDDYLKRKNEIADKEKQGFIDKGQMDKLVEAHGTEKANWQEQYSKETSEYKDKLTTLQGQLEGEVIDNQLLRHLSPIAVDKMALRLLMSEARPMVEMTEVDGKPVGRVMNAMNGDGTNKSFADLAKDFSENEEFARYIKGSNASGSGALDTGSGGAGKKTMKRNEFENLDPESQQKYMREDGAVTD